MKYSKTELLKIRIKKREKKSKILDFKNFNMKKQNIMNNDQN